MPAHELVPELVLAGPDEYERFLPEAADGEVEVWAGNDGFEAYGYTSGGFCWAHFPGVASFRFLPDQGNVVALADASVSPDSIEDTYLRGVLPLVLQLRGHEVLHASAVSTAERTCRPLRSLRYREVHLRLRPVEARVLRLGRRRGRTRHRGREHKSSPGAVPVAAARGRRNVLRRRRRKPEGSGDHAFTIVTPCPSDPPAAGRQHAAASASPGSSRPTPLSGSCPTRTTSDSPIRLGRH